MENDFYKLPKEMQLHLLDSQHDLLKGVIYERSRIIPTISSLSAMLLIIATFNDLIPLTNVVRVIISIFLFLIPFSLFVSNEELKKAQKNALANIAKYLGQDMSKDVKITSFEKFISRYPDIAIWILAITISILILLIWEINIF
mgnify:CR=1 FL=1